MWGSSSKSLAVVQWWLHRRRGGGASATRPAETQGARAPTEKPGQQCLQGDVWGADFCGVAGCDVAGSQGLEDCPLHPCKKEYTLSDGPSDRWCAGRPHFAVMGQLTSDLTGAAHRSDAKRMEKVTLQHWWSLGLSQSLISIVRSCSFSSHRLNECELQRGYWSFWQLESFALAHLRHIFRISSPSSTARK